MILIGQVDRPDHLELPADVCRKDEPLLLQYADDGRRCQHDTLAIELERQGLSAHILARRLATSAHTIKGTVASSLGMKKFPRIGVFYDGTGGNTPKLVGDARTLLQELRSDSEKHLVQIGTGNRR
jgi:hypothetical protein